MKSLGFKLDLDFVSDIKTADNTKHLVPGVFYVPVEFRDELHTIVVFSVPSVPVNMIFGIDFFRKFNIMLYMDKDGWSCNSLTLEENSDKLSRNKIVSFHNLSSNQQDLLNETVSKFKSLSSGRLGRTHIMKHVIDTGDALPVRQNPYPVSPIIQEKMGKQLQRMIDLNVVEPSFSPWCSPVVLVKKKDGGDRLCIDSRKLNAVTKRDSYPLPRVSEILDRLGRTNFLSKIDLKDAFWQIPLSEDSKAKTAFAVPGYGLYQFKRLPFGLHNAAQCLQRLMNSIFGSVDHRIFVYLDDLIITSESFEEHLSLLEFVFERLNHANLTVNFEKSNFCCSSLAYLGYVVDNHGLHTDPEKVKVILEFPLPKTYTQLKRFIGLASWYRRFVKDFATITAPLHDLTKGITKGRRIEWNEPAKEAFATLKEKLVSTPILITPDFSQPFAIHCDASNFGIGAVLCQGKNELPVAYASRKFRGTEVNYAAPEKECLAVLFAIEKFRPYVEGYEFTVITDCSALTYLFSQENPPGRLARWIITLSQYKFKTVHRKGVNNVVPDAISRTVEHLALISVVPKPEDAWYIRMLSKVALSPNRFKEWLIKDNKLYFNFHDKSNRLQPNSLLLVVPESARKEVLLECHDSPMSSHFGSKKTKAKILERYYWPGIGKDVEKYVKNCVICKQIKHKNTKPFGLMGKFKDAKRPFQMISLDLMGPLPRSSKQNSFLLVILDWFTKFPMLFPLKKATASKIADILEKNWFLLFGVPEIVVVDNGQQFAGKTFRSLMDKYGVSKLWYNSKYHPQNNPTERTNRTIGQALRAYVDGSHKNWDSEIPYIGLALRTAVHEITGYSPFFLNFGRRFTYSGTDYDLFTNDTKIDKPIAQRVQFLDEFETVFKEISSKIRTAFDKNKKNYDKKRTAMSYRVGDLVLKRNFTQSSAIKNISSKLNPVYIPCRVIAKTSDLVYELADLTGRKIGKWHVKDIFPY